MVSWKISDGLVDYQEAITFMDAHVQKIQTQAEPSLIWILEHPPLYTAGTSAKKDELLDPKVFPIYEVGRGGRFTYHGPGQKIIYLMMDLNNWKKDVRSFVQTLEQWVIDILNFFGVKGERREDRIGIWVTTNQGEKKIASIGVRVQKWVTSHGISLNVCPDLDHFSGIVPCGIKEYGVTSLKELGICPDEVTLIQIIQKHCPF